MNSHATKKIERYCPKHGKYSATQHSIFGNTLTTMCLECEKELEEEERKEEQLQLRIVAGIPLRFQDKEIENFNVKSEALAGAVSVCRRFAVSDKKGRSLILIGPPNIGKTHLACGTLKSCSERSKMYTTLIDIFSEIKSSYNSKRGETQYIKRAFFEPEILCIDNMETFSNTPENKKLLFELVNGRYNNLKSTIYCTNLSQQGLIDLIGEPLYMKMITDGMVKVIK